MLKLVRKEQPVTAEQYLKDEDWPDGVRADGFCPATNTWGQLTITMANGQKAPVNETDWVITNALGDRFVYTNEQKEALFGDPAPEAPEKEPESPRMQFKSKDKVVGTLEVKDGVLCFNGPCKKLAQNLFDNTQELIDAYIAEQIESLSDDEVLKRIIAVGILKRSPVKEVGRDNCLCCGVKERGQQVYQRYSDTNKVRAHVCEKCIVKLAMLAHRTKESK